MQGPQLQAEHPGATALEASGILLLAQNRAAGRTPDRLARQARGAALAHDARNLISALDLYCDLLAAPGVLAPGFGDYAADLRRLAGTGAELIAALVGSGSPPSTVSRYPDDGRSLAIAHGPLRRRRFPEIEDLASELIALERPLRALAGPGVRLEIECAPCAGRLGLNSEDLLRILFNLVANSVEALAAVPAELRRSPLLRITAQRGGAASFLDPHAEADSDSPHQETVILSVRDNGPGIPAQHLPHIFAAGFSTRGGNASPIPSAADNDADREAPQGEAGARGLGLSIVAQLVAAAGGAVRAVSPSGLGTRFDIELPILTAAAPAARAELAAPCMQGGVKTGVKRKIPHLQQISAQIEKEA